MNRFYPDDLLAWTNGKWQGPQKSVEITGFSNDTRTLKAGDMFVALKTDRRDGHDYLQNAVKKKASAALVERIDTSCRIPQLKVSDTLVALQSIAHEHRKRFTAPVIGITGSCGKTSTKDLLSLLLGQEETHKTAANLNNLLGVPLTLLGIEPDKHKYAVVEAGMNEPGEMARLAWMIEPDISIITMVGAAHLEGVGSLYNIAYEKSALGRSTRRNGRVIFPYSCYEFATFRDFIAPSNILVREDDAEDAFELPPEFSIPYKTEATGGGGSCLTLWRESSAPLTFQLPVWSPAMDANAALTITTALSLGVSAEDIQTRLNLWKPSRYRGEVIHTKQNLFYVDCYNSNPDSLANAVAAFTKVAPEDSPRLYVLGCMNELGVDADKLHELSGREIPVRSQDRVVIVGTHARAFKRGIVARGLNQNQIKVVKDAEDVRDSVARFKGSILLKGSRSYQLERLLKQPSRSHKTEKSVTSSSH